MNEQKHNIEPIIWLLSIMVIFYSVLLIAVAKLMASDGQTFQIIAGLTTAFGGALLGRINPRKNNEENPPFPPAPNKVVVEEMKKTTSTDTKTDV